MGDRVPGVIVKVEVRLESCYPEKTGETISVGTLGG